MPSAWVFSCRCRGWSLVYRSFSLNRSEVSIDYRQLFNELFVYSILSIPFQFSVVGVWCMPYPFERFIRIYWQYWSVIRVKFSCIIRSFGSTLILVSVGFRVHFILKETLIVISYLRFFQFHVVLMPFIGFLYIHSAFSMSFLISMSFSILCRLLHLFKCLFKIYIRFLIFTFLIVFSFSCHLVIIVVLVPMIFLFLLLVS